MLLNIVQPFKRSQNVIQQQYGHDLEESIAAMAVSLEPPTAPYLASSQDGIGTQIDNTEQDLHSELFALSQSLTRQNDCHFWFNEGYLWPCESPSSILEQLRLENYKSFSPTLQQSLISFGMLATKLQHLLRIQDAKLTQDDKKFLEELKSAGHSNWNPAHYPEWLLLEIDNNILIRPLQVDVAKAIISPQSSHNSVLQMNMGTGKETTSIAILNNLTNCISRKNIGRDANGRARVGRLHQALQSYCAESTATADSAGTAEPYRRTHRASGPPHPIFQTLAFQCDHIVQLQEHAQQDAGDGWAYAVPSSTYSLLQVERATATCRHPAGGGKADGSDSELVGL